MSAADAFRDLHRRGCFVLPNPWDAGGARQLEQLGFAAVATTSSGMAWSMARPDGGVGVDDVLAHVAAIVAATSLPVNADFEHGYAEDVAAMAEHVRRCVATGVAGLSIEDATGRSEDPLYPFDLAVQRVRAARRAIDETGSGVLLTARAECFLTGHPDPLAESVRRIAAYAEAGADVLYAPGPKTSDDIATIVAAADGKPVNTLVYGDFGLRVADIAALGTRRISIGGALARAAWAAFIEATRLIRDEGSFAGFAANGASSPLNPFFGDDLKARS